MPNQDIPVTPQASTPVIAPNGVTISIHTQGESPKVETPKEVDVETLIPTDSYQTDPLFYQVADYFNIKSSDYANAKDYLSEIVDYAIREAKSNDPIAVLQIIRSLEDRVQPPQFDEKRYWNIRKYVRLASKRSSIDKAMKVFERGEKV